MSIFPARILLATDGSADAELALTTDVDIAKITDSELHVVTAGPGNPDPVYGIHEAGLQYETYEQALEAGEREAQRYSTSRFARSRSWEARSRGRTSVGGRGGTRP